MGAIKLKYYEQKSALEVNANFFGSALEKNAPKPFFCLNAYTYGFQGMLRDDETSGSGNHYTTFERPYDPRLGRWWKLDPVFHAGMSPFNAFDNNPIYWIDPRGSNAGDYYKKDGTYLGSDGIDDDKVYTAESVTKDDEGLVKSASGSSELGVSHTEFTTSANVVNHESSGDKTESLWIAHAANNAKDNDAIDWKRQNTTLYEQLTDKSFSTTPSSARTPLSVTNSTQSANNARAAVLDVLSGGADPTGGAVLWDGFDFAQKGIAHNKFKEYTSVNISNSHLNDYAMGPRRSGNSLSLNFMPALVLQKDFSVGGNPRRGFSLHSTGAPGAGKTIFWRIQSATK